MIPTARERGVKSRLGLFTIFVAGALPAIIVDFDGSAYSYAAPFIINAVNLPIYYLGILISGYAAGIAIFSVIGGFLFDKVSPKITVSSSIIIFSIPPTPSIEIKTAASALEKVTTFIKYSE